MNKITAAIYDLDPDRYILISGHEEGAPRCSFGNIQEWVGYDTKSEEYIRFTKSVFKRLIADQQKT